MGVGTYRGSSDKKYHLWSRRVFVTDLDISNEINHKNHLLAFNWFLNIKIEWNEPTLYVAHASNRKPPIWATNAITVNIHE